LARRYANFYIRRLLSQILWYRHFFYSNRPRFEV
jgi:hypothetical protein